MSGRMSNHTRDASESIGEIHFKSFLFFHKLSQHDIYKIIVHNKKNYQSSQRFSIKVHEGSLSKFTRVLYQSSRGFSIKVRKGSLSKFTRVLYQSSRGFSIKVHEGSLSKFAKVLYQSL